MDNLNQEAMFDSKSEAIASIFDRLDKDICKTCEKRVFLECDSVPFKPEGADEEEVEEEAVEETPPDENASQDPNANEPPSTPKEDKPGGAPAPAPG